MFKLKYLKYMLLSRYIMLGIGIIMLFVELFFMFTNMARRYRGILTRNFDRSVEPAVRDILTDELGKDVAGIVIRYALEK